VNDKQKKIAVGILGVWFLFYGCAGTSRNSAPTEVETEAEQEEKVEAIDSDHEVLKPVSDSDQTLEPSDDANRKEASLYLSQAEKFLGDFREKENYQLLEQALEEVMTASGISPDDPSVKETLLKIEGMIQVFDKQALHDYGLALQAARNENWEEALRGFKELENRYPDYRDVKTKWLEKCGNAILSQKISGEAEKLVENKEWEGALKKFQEALKITPDSTRVTEGIAAVQRSIKEERIKMNLAASQEAMAKKDWDKAIEKFSAILKEEPEHETALRRIKEARKELAKDVAKESVGLMEKGKYPEALVKAKRALELVPDFPEVKTKLANMVDLAAESHYNNAKKFIERNLWGNALVELNRVESLVPGYRDVNRLILHITERLRENAKLKIAVVRFANLTGEKGLENLFCASLTSAFKEKSGGQVQIYSESIATPQGFNELEMARKIQKKVAARIFLFGEIRSYKTSQKRTCEMARKKYVVTRVVRRNLNYDRARMQALIDGTPFNPHGALPDRVVKVFDEYKYPVCHVEKYARMDVRALIVDVDSGFVSRKFGSEQQVKTDDYTVDAYPHAGVEPDPLDLPSDSSILREVFDKTVRKMVVETPLINDLHQYYVDLGKKYEEKDDVIHAVEEYMRAHTMDPERNIMNHILKLKKYD
jgi:tetratricopeptide (TPR) repeat protein